MVTATLAVTSPFVLVVSEDANALMSEFPSYEADELVTKQFLRAELAELRVEMAERFHQQTVWLGGAIAAATAVLAALTTIT